MYSMFGWTINLILPLAGVDYCHPANCTCSVLDHVGCIPSTMSSFRSVLHVLLPLHPHHYLSTRLSSTASTFLTTLQLRIKLSFCWTRQEFGYYPGIHPSKSNTPVPSVRFPYFPHKSSIFTPFFVPLLPPWHQPVLKYRLQRELDALSCLCRIHFAPIKRHALEFIDLTILISWCRVGDNEDGGDPRGGSLAALLPTWLWESMFNGMTSLGCGKESRNRKRSRFLWEAGQRIRTCRVVESHWKS